MTEPDVSANEEEAATSSSAVRNAQRNTSPLLSSPKGRDVQVHLHNNKKKNKTAHASKGT
jgi:hypothetical protein